MKSAVVAVSTKTEQGSQKQRSPLQEFNFEVLSGSAARARDAVSGPDLDNRHHAMSAAVTGQKGAAA